jgi:hypothetical protein
MTLIVTDHAVERYAERIIGLDPQQLTDRDRNMIAASIRTSLDRWAGAGARQVKTGDAVFILKRNVVLTVKPRKITFDWRSFKGRHRETEFAR